MDCIGCDWFQNIWPQFLKVVWMDFGKYLPCQYISHSFEWADSFEVKVVGQLGRIELDSLESHQLKRPSAKFRQYHAIYQVKYFNSFLVFLMKGANRLILLGLQVSHIRHTGCQLLMRTITRHLLAVGYRSHRLARCPRWILVFRHWCSQWIWRHCVWNIHYWRHCIFTDKSRFKWHHTDGQARVHRRHGERHIDVCDQGTDDNVGPSVIVWAGFHYGGKNDLVVQGGTMNQQVYRRVLQQSLLPRARAAFQNSFVLLHPIHTMPLGISWRTRTWIGHPKVVQVRTLLGLDGGSNLWCGLSFH